MLPRPAFWFRWPRCSLRKLSSASSVVGGALVRFRLPIVADQDALRRQQEGGVLTAGIAQGRVWSCSAKQSKAKQSVCETRQSRRPLSLFLSFLRVPAANVASTHDDPVPCVRAACILLALFWASSHPPSQICGCCPLCCPPICCSLCNRRHALDWCGHCRRSDAAAPTLSHTTAFRPALLWTDKQAVIRGGCGKCGARPLPVRRKLRHA